MKGYRFLKDGDIINNGDEFKHPTIPKKWEKIGNHMIGSTYTRESILLTMRRLILNSKGEVK